MWKWTDVSSLLIFCQHRTSYFVKLNKFTKNITYLNVKFFSFSEHYLNVQDTHCSIRRHIFSINIASDNMQIWPINTRSEQVRNTKEKHLIGIRTWARVHGRLRTVSKTQFEDVMRFTWLAKLERNATSSRLIKNGF